MNPLRPLTDSTLPLLAGGYAWLPGRWQRTDKPVVRTRLLGKHAVALRGPDAVRFFYDEQHIKRQDALPDPVLATLFGHGAVHTLDGETHRVRKAMFLSLLTDPTGVGDLTGLAAQAWDDAAESWADTGGRVVLFDEASRILTRAVCRWTGIPLRDDEVTDVASDLVAMVDGFASPGPRHARARRARARREAWLAGLVERIRADASSAMPDSAAATVAAHRDAEGALLSPHDAAVELLNIIRPTVAVSWFIAFAAHALYRWPDHRERLVKESPAYTDAPGAYAEAFAHEVRRFYPFAPFVGGLAVSDLTWQGEPIPEGSMVLLDLYGQNHSEDLWQRPYVFDPNRFLQEPPQRDELIPQGGGDPVTGHRCPGEDIAVSLLQTLSLRLAHLEYDVPDQDLRIPLRRLPAKVRSGFVLDGVQRPAR
ncbi:cytochrome P450 [Streptomyces monticola]|uniref:Cytochrome P450 n=1 Tax=Streptomyces monticola TaxID=2666263 RepID=A0ABW2JUX9_9ACTN